jgi:hypothetical protein
VTVSRSITICCDDCFEMIESEEFVAVHLGPVWAGALGWSYDTEGRNWCPTCTARRHEEKERSKRGRRRRAE